MELAFQRVEEKMITKTGQMYYLKGDEPKNIQTFVVSGGTMDMLLAAIDEAFEQYQPRHPNDKITSVNYCLSFAWKKLERDKAITSGKTAQPITRVRSYQIINGTAAKLGLTEIGCHTMRKTFGYFFYKKTRDIATLQMIFNHSHPQITLRYIGINQDLMDEAVDSFSL
ncbi:hypothetical protein A616_19380 [Brevibacillus brevis X23]|nr:hypothetical protein A616_19380 [Brevibacillus brevis X23]